MNKLSVSNSIISSNKIALLFAAISGISVANVYYAQPLLDTLANDFNIARATIGLVITLTQVGSILALLFIVPLGDIVKRRSLLIVQSILLCCALTITANSYTPLFLYSSILAVGLLGTAMTQGTIAYAASYADKADQGRIVGIAQSGVVIGILLARTFSGIIADIISWRAVYYSSAILTLGLLLVIWYTLPEQKPDKIISYRHLLGTMGSILRHDHILQVRGILAFLMFMAFNIFWSALALPLSQSPFNYSLAMIGAFGLIGAVGALGAAKAGVLADLGFGQKVTALSLVLLILAWLPLSLMSLSIGLLIFGIIILDLGCQALHVTNQSMIFYQQTTNHSRLVACYMLFYALGSAFGAFSTTYAYAIFGWNGVCLLGVGVSLIALVFWWHTRKFTQVIVLK